MAKKYQPAIFQPTVRPDWGGTLSYLSDAEKSEILTALVKYPSVECNSRFWVETIKPDLDLQLSKFMNSNAVKSRGALNRWGKISIPYPNHMDNTSIPNDNHIDKISNPYGIDTEREREKEEESKSIDENTIFQAGGQMWVMPTQFRKLAKKHWTEEEIRKIEQEHSCHENLVELSITELLASNPPKPKTTRFVKPTLEEIDKYCRSRRNNVDARKFYNYYESNGWKVGKNPMKSWEAAVRTWERSEYNSNQEFIPLTPEIADKSTFVRAKPL